MAARITPITPITPSSAPVAARLPQQRTAPGGNPGPQPAPSPTPPRDAGGPAGTTALVRLLTGHGVATAAQTATGLAAGAAVLDSTGSASLASTTVALGVLPYVVFSGMAGVLADAVSRSAVLAWSCALRGLLTAATALAVAVQAPAGWLALLTGLTAVAATPAYPAVAAAVPQCVPDRNLERANAAATGVENLSWIAGPGLFGVLTLAGTGPATVAGVAAVACLVAAGLVARVRLSLPERATGTGRRSGWAAEAFAGMRVLRLRRRLRAAMGLAVVDNFLYGYLVVSLVLLGEEAAGPTAGASTSALTLGAVVAVVGAGRLATRVPVARLVTIALVAFVVSAAAAGLSGHPWLGLVLVAGAGAATLLAEISAVTLLQRDSDPTTVARVFGVYDQLNVGAIAAGSALAGPLAQALGPGAALAVVATVCLVPVAGLARGTTAP